MRDYNNKIGGNLAKIKMREAKLRGGNVNKHKGF